MLVTGKKPPRTSETTKETTNLAGHSRGRSASAMARAIADPALEEWADAMSRIYTQSALGYPSQTAEARAAETAPTALCRRDRGDTTLTIVDGQRTITGRYRLSGRESRGMMSAICPEVTTNGRVHAVDCALRQLEGTDTALVVVTQYLGADLALRGSERVSEALRARSIGMSRSRYRRLLEDAWLYVAGALAAKGGGR